MNPLQSLQDGTSLAGRVSLRLEGPRRNWVRMKWPRGEWGGGMATLSPHPRYLFSPLSSCFLFDPSLTSKPVHRPNGTFPGDCFFWDNFLIQGDSPPSDTIWRILTKHWPPPNLYKNQRGERKSIKAQTYLKFPSWGTRCRFLPLSTTITTTTLQVQVLFMENRAQNMLEYHHQVLDSK